MQIRLESTSDIDLTLTVQNGFGWPAETPLAAWRKGQDERGQIRALKPKEGCFSAEFVELTRQRGRFRNR
jgi:hypothetical protein